MKRNSRYASMYERLVANTLEPVGELSCWEWSGHIDRDGYARINVWRDGKTVKLRAHVVMSELLDGPVPKDREVDHRCKNRRCICPDHLEQVSRVINRARRDEPWRIERRIEDSIAIALARVTPPSASPAGLPQSSSPLPCLPDSCSVSIPLLDPEHPAP